MFIQDELDVDLQATKPVVLYLNNQYWGLYFIRDRLYKGFVGTYHEKVDKDNIDLIKFPKEDRDLAYWIYEQVREGDNIDYHAWYNFLESNSLAGQSNYEYAKSKIDFNSFVDYFITQIYYSNSDP